MLTFAIHNGFSVLHGNIHGKEVAFGTMTQLVLGQASNNDLFLVAEAVPKESEAERIEPQTSV